MGEDVAGANSRGLPRQEIIDRQSCMGSGNCVYWAPDVFDLDHEGIAIVIGDLSGYGDQARLAAENCPTAAIHVEGSAPRGQR